MTSRQRIFGRMLRHDALIGRREVAGAFTRWSDRVLLVLGAATAFAALHALLADISGRAGSIPAMAFGVAIGLAVAMAVERRLFFLAHDSVLAADASQRRLRTEYRLVAYACLVGSCLAVILLIRPRLAAWLTAGIVAGLAMGGVTGHLALWNHAARLKPRTGAKWAWRQIAGACLAIGSVMLSGSAPSLSPHIVSVSVGAGAFASVLTFARIDPSCIRFEAIVGRCVGGGLRRALSVGPIVLCLQVAGTALIGGVAVAGITAAAGLAAVLVCVVRVLAYRAYPERTADLMLAGFLLLAGCIGAGFAPLLVPTVIGGVAVLYRRAVAATWLMP